MDPDSMSKQPGPPRPSLVPFLSVQMLARMRRYDAAGVAATAAPGGVVDDERVVALTIWAQGSLRRGDHQAAVDDYAAVLDVDPGNQAARVAKALGLRALGRVDQAIEELGRVHAQGDGRELRFGQALVMAEMGPRADAPAEARRAHRLKPGNSVPQELAAKLAGP